MSNKKDGGAAFPMLEAWKEDSALYCPDRGMSLRDYFAGQALVGLVSLRGMEYGNYHLPCEVEAQKAYSIANAMLAERKKYVS